MPNKHWTKKEIKLIAAKLKEGLSYKDIALLLPDANRNKVAGAVTRYNLRGLSNSREIKKLQPKKKRVRKPLERTQPIIIAPEIIDLEIPLTQRKSLLELNPAKHCRWPVNDPKGKNFFFCGGNRLEHSVYCECHARRAHRPSVKKPSELGGLQTKSHMRKEDAVARS